MKLKVNYCWTLVSTLNNTIIKFVRSLDFPNDDNNYNLFSVMILEYLTFFRKKNINYFKENVQ